MKKLRKNLPAGFMVKKRPYRGSTFLIGRYIATEYIINFLVSFFFFFVMFLVNQLLVMAGTLLEKRIPLSSVTKMLFYYTPYLIGMTFPFATLVGCLMSIGRFSSDNEIQAIRASGLRYTHIFRPLILVSLVLFLISLTMNSYFMYVSAKKRNQLMFDIAYSQPELIINPNSNTSHGEMVIYAGDIKNSHIQDLVIIDKDNANNRRVIMAEEAKLAASSKQKGVSEVQMNRVFAHSVPQRNRDEFDFIQADQMSYNILIDEGSGISISSISDQDKTLWMLLKEIRELNKKQKEKSNANIERELKIRYLLRLNYDEVVNADYYQPQFRSTGLNFLQTKYESLLASRMKEMRNEFLNRKQSEIHKKLFMPVGCIAMTILAFPLGMFAKRSGKSVGFILGVMISGVYWFLFMIFFILSRRVDQAPPSILWIPNLLICAIGYVLYLFRIRH